MSNTPFSISPINLSKLSMADSIRLCQYIEAIERQNKTKSDQQVFMVNYIQSLKAQVDQMMIADRQRKKREEEFIIQINILTQQNMNLRAQLKQYFDKTTILSQQLRNLKQISVQSHQLRVKIQNQYQQQLNKIIQENNEIIKSLEDNRTEQLNRILSLNHQLDQKCKKFQQLYAQSVQNSLKLQQSTQQLFKQNICLRQQLAERRQKEQQQKIMQSNQIMNLSQYLRFIEEKNKQLIQQNFKFQQQFQKQEKLRMQLQKQLFDKQKIYVTEIQECNIRQKQLEEFIQFVKENVRQMQGTIDQQNKKIQILQKSNDNLRNNILQNLTNMEEESIKQKQINLLKMQLASYKGKLAEKQRQFSTCSSRALITPFEEYSFRLKIKSEELQDDRKSKRSNGTYSERQRYEIEDVQNRIRNYNAYQSYVIKS